MKILNKTELKGVAGQEVFYTKEKNKLNSIYGMSAQDPAELLEESSKHAFLSYAWARLRLEEGIRLASSQPWGDGFVYCDTDSVKYVGSRR